jgi:hypothetical protein
MWKVFGRKDCWREIAEVGKCMAERRLLKGKELQKENC